MIYTGPPDQLHERMTDGDVVQIYLSRPNERRGILRKMARRLVDNTMLHSYLTFKGYTGSFSEKVTASTGEDLFAFFFNSTFSPNSHNGTFVLIHGESTRQTAIRVKAFIDEANTIGEDFGGRYACNVDGSPRIWPPPTKNTPHKHYSRRRLLTPQTFTKGAAAMPSISLTPVQSTSISIAEVDTGEERNLTKSKIAWTVQDLGVSANAVAHLAKMMSEYKSGVTHDDAATLLMSYGMSEEDKGSVMIVVSAATSSSVGAIDPNPANQDVNKLTSLTAELKLTIDAVLEDYKSKLHGDDADDSSCVVAAAQFIPVEDGLTPENTLVMDTLFATLSSKKETYTKFMGSVNERLKATEKAVDKAMRSADAFMSSQPTVTYLPTAGFPNTTFKMRKMFDVFKVPKSRGEEFSFEIPYFEHDSPHPLVPMIDPDYVWDLDLLRAIGQSVRHDSPAWLTGPPGSGKSSSLQQYAARTMMPFKRVNLDGEIDRLAFVGRDSLKDNGNGTTISEFIEGVLPTAMRMPCILCLDEADMSRPEIDAILFGPLEKNGTPLMLAENGGQLVYPHRWWRIFATSNTKGTGDNTRTLQGVRPKSMAYRNRYTAGMLTVDYMAPMEEVRMIQKRVPKADKLFTEKLVKFGGEMRKGFRLGQIMESCTPRDLLAISRAVVHLSEDCLFSVAKATDIAMQDKIYNRCTDVEVLAIKKFRELLSF